MGGETYEARDVPLCGALFPRSTPERLPAETVDAARRQWVNVWIVADGSTDASHEGLEEGGKAGLRVIVQARNGGKGSAVLAGAREALAAGFTHALVMDADGQHPAGRIRQFMEMSSANPAAVVCGRPVFGAEAPRVRLYGRKLSVGLVHLETSGRGAADPLFGFRVYPLEPLVRVLGATRGGRRYDFDPEAAVRLAWEGVPAINVDAECTYVARERGGVSHFRYLRDNLRMIAMHTRLIYALVTGRQGGRRA